MLEKPLKAHLKEITSARAISIRQPMVEEILQGKKKYEYRSRLTHIRGRVYLYASMGKTDDPKRWKKVGFAPGELQTGLIVGSVEITDCRYFDKYDCYGYKLSKPKRYRSPIKPMMSAQPCFFFPFGKEYKLL